MTLRLAIAQMALVAFVVSAGAMPGCSTARAGAMPCCKENPPCPSGLNAADCCRFEPASDAAVGVSLLPTRSATHQKMVGPELLQTVSIVLTAPPATSLAHRSGASPPGPDRSTPLFLLNASILC